MEPLKALVIGLGNQSNNEHIPALLLNQSYRLRACVDPNPEALSSADNIHKLQAQNVGLFLSLNEALSFEKYDIAIVAVPHNEYRSIIDTLASHRIHVLKEKPFATSLEEAQHYESLCDLWDIKIMTSLQRKFHPLYVKAKTILPSLGVIKSVNATYTIPSKHPNGDWRSDTKLAGGGVMLDMGYHFLDLITWLLGHAEVREVFLDRIRDGEYDTDDTSYISFSISPAIRGIIFTSCVYPEKKEEVIIVGSEGSLVLKRDQVTHYGKDHTPIESYSTGREWLPAMSEQLDYFAKVIRGRETHYESDPTSQIENNIKIMSQIYGNNS